MKRRRRRWQHARTCGTGCLPGFAIIPPTGVRPGRNPTESRPQSPQVSALPPPNPSTPAAARRSHPPTRPADGPSTTVMPVHPASPR